MWLHVGKLISIGSSSPPPHNSRFPPGPMQFIDHSQTQSGFTRRAAIKCDATWQAGKEPCTYIHFCFVQPSWKYHLILRRDSAQSWGVCGGITWSSALPFEIEMLRSFAKACRCSEPRQGTQGGAYQTGPVTPRKRERRGLMENERGNGDGN